MIFNIQAPNMIRGGMHNMSQYTPDEILAKATEQLNAGNTLHLF